MGSYGDLWRARMRLARPGNASMAAIGVIVGMAVALEPWRGAFDPRYVTALIAAPLAAWFVTAFGNVINDLHDQDVDRTAHPERPLPAGRISASDAKAWAILLLGFGLLEAWVAAGTDLVLFAAVNALLLWIYESLAKRHGLPGNLLVAFLVASTFAFGAYAVAGWPGIEAALPLAIMAALATLAREIIKDVEDMEADRGHRRTLAHVYPRGARFLATASLAAAIGYVLAIATQEAWRALAWGPLAVGIMVFLAGLEQSWRNPGRAQRLLKLGMLAMLATFLAAAY